jgi:glycerophosphoryl diester phosphodiesterase
VDELIAKAKKMGVDGLDIQAQPPVDAAFIKAVKDAGLEFYAWTVDDPERAKQLIRDGAAGITSNRPKWLREQVTGPDASTSNR